ncbi:conserved hypothetical protein [Paraburkholderia atlantica]|uniref:Uncharacterized protein n=1 Tax=Paraburkholderia atlantica TaxID=2654982 RepID=D5WMX5_PARAM|nr:hypothetical protein [Paraburkholderia atlantica]ADG20571.1 conserved hypothetical protein [Paraburkholderia atlantica]
MEDALERRALLLHLGRVMQLIVRLDDMAPSAATIGELIARHPILDDEPLLAQLRADMPVAAFRTRALHAFCRWPQRLLDNPLDRDALAASVRASLFSDNPRGWRAYVDGLRRDVAWFDAKAASRRSSRRVADVAPSVPDDGPPPLDPPAGRGVATDVERGFGAAGDSIESVEGARRLDEGRADEQRAAR